MARREVPFSPRAIEYAKEICTYLFHVPGIWLQFSHLELEYYDKFYKPSQFRQQAAHAATWGEE